MHDREDRITSLLTELAAEFLQREANTDPLITVTHTTLSRDHHRATIYISVFPEGRDEDALVFLKRKGSEFRSYVKKKSNFKIIPFFDFAVDYGERNRQRIDEIANDS